MIISCKTGKSTETHRIFEIVVYQCEQIPKKKNKSYKFALEFTPEKLSINSCGKVSVENFNTNMTKILEAINYNSCLYKKIGVDLNGNIKNCPAMPNSFGNIHEMTLEQVLENSNFKEYWRITKDEIATCKDCEFRNVCTDCRAYTEQSIFNNEGIDLSKPLKCGYDPYSNEWTDWSQSPLKQEMIRYYGIDKLVVEK